MVLISLSLSAGAAPVEEWNRTYSNAVFYDVQQTSNDGYILAGIKTTNEIGLVGAYLIKTDSSGNEQWNRTFSGKNGNFISSMILTDDGYILAGSTYSSGRSDAWLIKKLM